MVSYLRRSQSSPPDARWGRRWTVVSIERVIYNKSGGEATLVLLRRKNGKAKVEELTGHWTHAQITGLP